MQRGEVWWVQFDERRLVVLLSGDDTSGIRVMQVVAPAGVDISGLGIEVMVGEIKAFIRKNELSRDRAEQRPERFAVGDKVDAKVTNVDKAARKLTLSIKAKEISEEKEAVAAYGSSDSGASLGDILGAALRKGKDKEWACGLRSN